MFQNRKRGGSLPSRKFLTVSIHHIAKYLKSGIPIYNSKVPDMAGKKKRKNKNKNTGNCKMFSVSRKRKNVIPRSPIFLKSDIFSFIKQRI